MKKRLYILFLILGLVLITAALVLGTATLLTEAGAKKETDRVYKELTALIPTPVNAVPDEYANKVMPTLDIGGRDFVGIIEAERYSVSLAVHNSWEKSRLTYYPCRYTGSAYDGSLIIGGKDSSGQLDFIDEISNGDIVSFTDVRGQRFSYEVAEIIKTPHVTTEKLQEGEWDLVLFAANSQGIDYTVVRCSLKG